MMCSILQVATITGVPQTIEDGMGKLGSYAVCSMIPRINSHKTASYRLLQTHFRLSEILQIRRYLCECTQPILHIHYALFGYMGWLNRYPYYLHCHGSDVHTNLYKPLLRELTRLFLKSAVRVFYSTPDLYQYIAPIRRDAIFIPNPINTERFRPGNTASQRPSILLISKLDKTKGVDIALNAIETLRQHYPRLPISMMGFGNAPNAPELLSRAQSLDIRTADRMPYERIPEWIQKHAIIVGQLVSGSLGCSELEAMACGKPIIAYFRHPAAYPEEPPVCNARSFQDVTTWLQKLLDSAELREDIGQRTRIWVERYHGYLKVCQQLLNYYELP